MRLRSLVLVGLILAAIPATANAGPLLTKRQAVRAVENEAYAAHEIAIQDISCQRLTRARMRCQWDGLSRLDIQRGNVDGWAGTAGVCKYQGGAVVATLRYTRRGE